MNRPADNNLAGESSPQSGADPDLEREQNEHMRVGKDCGCEELVGEICDGVVDLVERNNSVVKHATDGLPGMAHGRVMVRELVEEALGLTISKAEIFGMSKMMGELQWVEEKDAARLTLLARSTMILEEDHWRMVRKKKVRRMKTWFLEEQRHKRLTMMEVDIEISIPDVEPMVEEDPSMVPWINLPLVHMK